MSEHAIQVDEKPSVAIFACIKMETPMSPDFHTYNFISVAFILS